MTQALDTKDKPENKFIKKAQNETTTKLPEQEVGKIIDEVSLEVDQEGLAPPKIESVPDPEQGFIKKFATKQLGDGSSQ